MILSMNATGILTFLAVFFLTHTSICAFEAGAGASDKAIQSCDFTAYFTNAT